MENLQNIIEAISAAIKYFYTTNDDLTIIELSKLKN